MSVFSLRKLTALLVASASISSAFALTHESGAYADLNAGVLYASVSFLGYNYSAFGSAGLNTNLGYQFNRYFATELGYTAYGIDHDLLNNIDIAAKVIIPVVEGQHPISLFGKIGPSYVFAGGHGGTGALYTGLGAAYQMTDKLDLTAQAQGITQGFFSLGLVSLGVSYHF